MTLFAFLAAIRPIVPVPQYASITVSFPVSREMAGDECAIIDVGGQDTKIILVSGGMVQDFQMNDKCSAGSVF